MLRMLTAGESHGSGLVMILDGIPAGFPIDVESINRELSRRQHGYGAGGRMRLERDSITLIGGVMAGKTTGAPIAIYVENLDHKNWKGKKVQPLTTPRPGHADLTGVVKYRLSDIRPALERASARETTMRVAAGAVCKLILNEFGVTIGGYVSEIGGIKSRVDDIPFHDRIAIAGSSDVCCPDPNAAKRMLDVIKEAMQAKNTLGGIIEVVALGVPVGLGSYSQWDRRLDARLGAALLSIQAIKGVEIGDAWENSNLKGTEVQDAIALDGRNIIRLSNRAGGIEGGISNGEPILVRAAMKPIPSTLTPQQTVDLSSGKVDLTTYERSDFCPVPRAVPILEAMVAYIIADELLQKLGGDSLKEMMPRFDALKKASLDDINMDSEDHIWWQ
jgi:chorismate synthase